MRIFIWVTFAAACIVTIWATMSYVNEVDRSATKFQALDHFNSQR